MKKAYSIVLSLVLVLATVAFETGCSAAQTANIVAAVDAQLPIALNLAANLAAISGNPGLADIFGQINTAVAVDEPVIKAAIAAWKASKTTGNLSALARVLNALASNVNSRVLAANSLANAKTDSFALFALAGVAGVINGMAASLAGVNKTKSAELVLPDHFSDVIAFIGTQPRGPEILAQVADVYGVSPDFFR